MLKFFKELIASAKEGLAEARQELAQEKLEADAAQATKIATYAARLETVSELERFAVALAAPYRQTFSSELRDAREDGRPPVHMLCMEVAESESRSWTKLLARDFDVSDRESAVAAVHGFIMLAAEVEDADGLALWVARFCHLTSGCAAVGHIESAEALEWLTPATERAAETFSGWENYAEHFLAGEKSAPGSNPLGRKVLQGAVKTLLSDDISPWRLVRWPLQSSAA